LGPQEFSNFQRKSSFNRRFARMNLAGRNLCGATKS
jgi:hypothetical protein